MIRGLFQFVLISCVLVSGLASGQEARARHQDAVSYIQGGRVGFSAVERTCLDATSGFLDSIGLYGYDGAPLKAIQFRMLNTNGKIRITGVEPDPMLRLDPRWLFMWEIKHSHILPDLGTNDTVAVVILGQGDAELPPTPQQGLVRFTYETVDIDSSGDNRTQLEILDVVGALSGGADAMLTAGGGQTIALTNSIVKGDVNYDDDININDLLDVMNVILGRATYSGDTFSRADIAPWPAGDASINVKDLAMTQQIILEGQYPNGTPVDAAAPRACALARAPEVLAAKGKITVFSHAEGITVWMENTVPVKGIQLELSNVPVVPDTVKVSTIWGPGSWGHSGNVLRIIAADLSGGRLVDAGSRHVIDVAFPSMNPLQVSFKKLIVADQDNNAINDIEASLIYSRPNPVEEERGLPMYELSQNYPNPFNPSTRIQFHMPSAGSTRLVVYNMLGEEIKTLYSGYSDPGRHTVEWDATDESGAAVPSGVYIYTLYTSRTRFTRKMVYMR